MQIVESPEKGSWGHVEGLNKHGTQTQFYVSHLEVDNGIWYHDSDVPAFDHEEQYAVDLLAEVQRSKR
jgi:hypothetical protein